MLSVGIVGLPNVGKSSLFNALTSAEATVENYPFTTIDSNVGVVPVPDSRLQQLRQAVEPAECTPSHIEFIDIAGLVEGASHGEGLGNQFLDNIRKVDAIVHVLRCFEGETAHVFADVDPMRDVEVVETELLLADLEILKRSVEKRQKQWQTNPRKYATEKDRLQTYLSKLEAGMPLRSLKPNRQEIQELKSLGLLTGKPVVYAANVSEESYGSEGDPAIDRIRGLGTRPGALGPAVVIAVSAKIEAELAQLDADERQLFMSELGIEEPGLERLVEAAFEALGLMRFYTLANAKLRAWEVERGATASQAAGKIHSDMEAGFIRAQVASCEQVLYHRTFQELHHHGLLRTEGKDYEIEDGDVVEILFKAP